MAERPTVRDERWGPEGRKRYAAVLAAAMRQVAAEPDGPLSKKRPELRAGMSAGVARVRHPVHVLYHRIDREGVIEIVRVLHERMEPKRHLEEL